MRGTGHPRFAAGDSVRILEGNPLGHVRTPYYVRGKSGTIERYCGHFKNPEELAYGRYDHPPVALFRVRIPQTELWTDYAENPADTLEIEIYDHWLQPA